MKTKGFTIVELLIVIVVIVVLAAISVVAFNGVQQRARDSARKSDLAAVAKALSMYRIDKGNFIGAGSGCGGFGDGQGWLSHNSSRDGGYDQYPRSITDCLMDDRYLTKLIKDPKGCTDLSQPGCGTPTTAYMKMNCANGSTTYAYLLARLETQTTNPTADMASSFCPSVNEFIGYGMNYFVQVQ